jgi:hypothetical protein
LADRLFQFFLKKDILTNNNNKRIVNHKHQSLSIMKVTPNFSEFTCLHGFAMVSVVMLFLAWMNGNDQGEELVRVAMIGNSIMYYNDLPRLLEAMSGGTITQDSCLHGDASIQSHLIYGNGMATKWNTGQARMWDVDEKEAAEKEYYANIAYDDDASIDQAKIYDYGACTVEQLLLGVDDRLVEFFEKGGARRRTKQQQEFQWENRRQELQQHSIRNLANDDAVAAGDDASDASANDDNAVEEGQNNDDNANDDANGGGGGGNDDNYVNAAAAADDAYHVDDDAYYTATDDASSVTTYDDDIYQDKFNEKYPLQNDGTNPCMLSANYYFYKQTQYDNFGPPQWDYIVINDNSRYPCCTEQRQNSLELLKEVYVPWFIETGAIPIFMVTHAYWASMRDMSGLTDVPTFMSLTYEGYREYAEMVESLLPPEQKPRVAPVGLAFQLIWEENLSMWENLIHMDEIHLTPSGTFLEGLIVYGTIYGHLPHPSIVLNGDVANLFSNARRMTPSEHIQEAYPTLDQARYLYHIAARIMDGEIPRSFTPYENGESADFVPDDQGYQEALQNNNNR